MPLSRALIVSTAGGFCLSVLAGPALAANSQPRKLYSINTSAVKGSPSMHKKSATESELDQAGRSPDGEDTAAISGRFASMPENGRSLNQHH